MGAFFFCRVANFNAKVVDLRYYSCRKSLGRMSPSKHECMEGAHVTSHYRGGSIVRGINDIVPLCGKCNNGARQRHQMLWIEDKCREKEVDFTKDVIYMYYRDLVK